MAIQFSTAIRNAMMNQIDLTVGTSAVLKIRTGAQPANIAAADSGTVLATVTIADGGADDWLTAAASGAVAKVGTWEDTSADATGTAGHFVIYAADGTTRHIQGSVTATAGGGDMTVDNTSFAAAQAFTITAFGLTAGNA